MTARKVLVIEDSHDLRQQIVELLRLEGFDPIDAPNGVIGLEMARQRLPDIIVCDIMMPELDGYGVLAELRRDPQTQTIPFIFLTAKEDRPSLRKGMAIGADDYLTKPFKANELVSTIRTRLDKHALMLNQISRQIEELELLRRIDRELSYRFSPDWVVTIIMDWALRKTRATTGVLGKVDEESLQLRLEYVFTDQKDAPPKKGDLWAINGFIDQVLHSEQAITTSDVQQIPQLAGGGAAALLGVPLTTGKYVLGALILQSPKPEAFNPDILAFLSQMGNRAAIVLQQVNMFEEYTRKQLEELELRETFGRFVSPDVADAIRNRSLNLAGESRVVTVLFCDVRDFTAFSERSAPQQVVSMLNQYLTLVVKAAQMNGGTVNKFGGDSALILYGAPTEQKDGAYHAVLTALQLQISLQELNKQRAARGEQTILIGIGINTGEVVAGAIGPEERQEYTVIGDTVNLASRIQALNKTYPQHGILISDNTHAALGSRAAELECIDLGLLPIRGRAESVHIWAVSSFARSQAAP
jgi:class 3 adenylate cyclase/DNA-binding NarL/FixJ family response regulator